MNTTSPQGVDEANSGGTSNQDRAAERRKTWGELIARQKQSGKTVKAFCEENGAGGLSFYAWRSG